MASKYERMEQNAPMTKVYLIDQIIDQSGAQYLVTWKGYGLEDATWLKYHHMGDEAKLLVDAFKHKLRMQTINLGEGRRDYFWAVHNKRKEVAQQKQSSNLPATIFNDFKSECGSSSHNPHPHPASEVYFQIAPKNKHKSYTQSYELQEEEEKLPISSQPLGSFASSSPQPVQASSLEPSSTGSLSQEMIESLPINEIFRLVPEKFVEFLERQTPNLRKRMTQVSMEKLVAHLCSFFEFAELFEIAKVGKNGELRVSDKSQALFQEHLNLKFAKLTRKLKVDILTGLL